MRVKISKKPQPAPTASAVGPRPTLIQTSRTPRTWKFIQDHRTTRPPPMSYKLNYTNQTILYAFDIYQQRFLIELGIDIFIFLPPIHVMS